MFVSDSRLQQRIQEIYMPEKNTIQRAQEDAREGKAPSTQAGEFVREEIEHVKKGTHGARSAKQAIAIGLSKARRAGIKLPPPGAGKTSEKARIQATRDYAKGQDEPGRKASPRRSQATLHALQREGKEAASHAALSRQAKSSARRRSAASRSRSAQQAVRTKGEAGLRNEARKAAHTRAARKG
jgi:hypothetical protein